MNWSEGSKNLLSKLNRSPPVVRGICFCNFFPLQCRHIPRQMARQVETNLENNRTLLFQIYPLICFEICTYKTTYFEICTFKIIEEWIWKSRVCDSFEINHSRFISILEYMRGSERIEIGTWWCIFVIFEVSLIFKNYGTRRRCVASWWRKIIIKIFLVLCIYR